MICIAEETVVFLLLMREGLRVYPEAEAPRVPSRYALAYAEQCKRQNFANRFHIVLTDSEGSGDSPEATGGRDPAECGDTYDADPSLLVTTPPKYGPFDDEQFSGKPRADASNWI